VGDHRDEIGMIAGANLAPATCRLRPRPPQGVAEGAINFRPELLLARIEGRVLFELQLDGARNAQDVGRSAAWIALAKSSSSALKAASRVSFSPSWIANINCYNASRYLHIEALFVHPERPL
jgi:hypothetical protein